MAYKIIHESDSVHVIRPERWWDSVSLKDLVNALKELDGVVSVVRFGGLETAYVAITRARK